MLDRTATHGWHGSLPLWCSCFGGVTSWWKDPSLRTEIQAGVYSPPPALCIKHPTIYRLCLLRWITPMCPPFSLKLSTSCCIHKGMMVYPDSGLLGCPHEKKNLQPLCKTSVFVLFRLKAENESLAFHLTQCSDQTARLLPRRWAEAWVELRLSVCVSQCGRFTACPQGLLPLLLTSLSFDWMNHPLSTSLSFFPHFVSPSDRQSHEPWLSTHHTQTVALLCAGITDSFCTLSGRESSCSNSSPSPV